MSSSEVRKRVLLCVVLLGALAGCTEKPAIRIRAMPTENADGAAANPLVHEFQASISDEEWKKLQVFLQTLAPRLEAIEQAVLWLPQGTAMLVAGSNVIIEENRVLIENSSELVEQTARMIENAERVAEEAKKTRENIENLGKLLLAPRKP